MRCDRSEDRRRGLGFHEHRSGAAKDGQSVDRADDGTAGRRLASWLLDERPATDDDRVFVRYKAPHVALRGHSSVYEAISRVMRHAGLGRRGGSRLLRRNAATRMLEAATPLPTISAVLGHADPDSTRVYMATHRGECSRACCPCRKADRHETHGTRIRRPARRRIGGVHPLQGVHGQAWRHPRPGPALVRPALPRTRGRASGAGRRGAMDRP